MRALFSLLLAVGLLGVTVAQDKPAKGDAVEKELAKFAGEWRAVKIVVDGQEPVPEEELKALRLTITGNKRVIKIGDEVKVEAVFELDPTKTLKEIAVTVNSEGPLKGKKLTGIYEVTDDTHTIVLNLKGKGPPKKLESKEGSGHLLQKFERVKK